MIVNMATASHNGKSRKPLAVFFAQVKRELGYIPTPIALRQQM
jgi:hypothetical protein